jgi:hypothetical protein
MGNYGSLGGPLEAMLRSPEHARRASRLSDYFRNGTSHDQRINELAVSWPPARAIRPINGPYTANGRCATDSDAPSGKYRLKYRIWRVVKGLYAKLRLKEGDNEWDAWRARLQL